jgi:hypothetical protein
MNEIFNKNNQSRPVIHPPPSLKRKSMEAPRFQNNALHEGDSLHGPDWGPPIKLGPNGRGDSSQIKDSLAQSLRNCVLKSDMMESSQKSVQEATSGEDSDGVRWREVGVFDVAVFTKKPVGCWSFGVFLERNSHMVEPVVDCINDMFLMKRERPFHFVMMKSDQLSTTRSLEFVSEPGTVIANFTGVSSMLSIMDTETMNTILSIPFPIHSAFRIPEGSQYQALCLKISTENSPMLLVIARGKGATEEAPPCELIKCSKEICGRKHDSVDSRVDYRY